MNKKGWFYRLLNGQGIGFVAIIVGLTISACQLFSANAVLTPTVIVQLENTLAFPSTPVPKFYSRTSTPVVTDEPMASPSVTQTPEPTAIPASTITITPADGPSLTVTSTPWDHGYGWEKIRELYRSNGNCSLPCWWGIIPGETTLQEVEHFFAPYVEADVVIIEPFRYGVVLYYPPLNPDVHYNLATRLEIDRTDIISGISLDGETAMFSGFNPTYFLDNYGTPQNIWLSSHTLVMFYEDQRILIEYAIYTHKEKEQACFAAFNSLYLWSPHISWSDKDIKAKLNFDVLSEWEDATGQNIQAFHQAFRTFVGTENCFRYIIQN